MLVTDRGVPLTIQMPSFGHCTLFALTFWAARRLWTSFMKDIQHADLSTFTLTTILVASLSTSIAMVYVLFALF
jgi:hypothetical protein